MNRIHEAIAALAIAAGVAVTGGALAEEVPERDPADCALSAAEIYARKADSVVQIVSFGIDPYQVLGRVRPGTGSGIVLRPDLVLTNYHVVQGAQLIGIQSEAGTFDATLIGGDPALDIALLVPSWPLLTAEEVSFGTGADLAVGEPAYALGYPLGIGKTLSSGIVSGLNRLIPLNTISWTTRYIQTDAPVSPGNSGGALIDSCGRVIGMISLQSADPRAENMGYALPIGTILEVLDELEETGRVARPWHGLYGQMVNPLIQSLTAVADIPPPTGFLVETVEPGSAADRAGLRGGVFPVLWGMSEVLLGGDVIVEVDGNPIETLDDALAAVSGLEIGKEVSLLVWRAGETFEASVTLEERPVFDRDLALISER